MSRALTLTAFTVLLCGATVGAATQTPALPSQWIDDSASSHAVDTLVDDARRAAGTDDLWVGYTFALRDGVRIGCDEWRGRSVGFGADGVRLHIDEGARGHVPSSVCDERFGLFLRFEGSDDEVVEAHMMSWRRAVTRLEGAVVWIGALDAGESVAWLRDAVLDVDGGRLRAAGRDAAETRSRLLTAVAVHAGNAAEEVVLMALNPQHPEELRDSAVFWSAQIGRERGLQELLRLAREDVDPDMREQALFWLGQAAGERVTEDLAEIAADDPEVEVRRAAVFALSQSEDDGAIDALIEIVRTHDDREVVKAALFWLGQSGDARAVALIEEILFGRAP